MQSIYQHIYMHCTLFYLLYIADYDELRKSIIDPEIPVTSVVASSQKRIYKCISEGHSCGSWFLHLPG